jgi:hypothetical protein
MKKQPAKATRKPRKHSTPSKARVNQQPGNPGPRLTVVPAPLSHNDSLHGRPAPPAEKLERQMFQ